MDSKNHFRSTGSRWKQVRLNCFLNERAPSAGLSVVRHTAKVVIKLACPGLERRRDGIQSLNFQGMGREHQVAHSRHYGRVMIYVQFGGCPPNRATDGSTSY
jgi:hypothetical protein